LAAVESVAAGVVVVVVAAGVVVATGTGLQILASIAD